MSIERFYRKVVVPALVGTSKWRGTATINSGSTSVVVSASGLAVTSLNPPLLSLGTTTVASHRKLVLSCDSIVTNTSFCIVSDLAPNGGNQQVVYTIVN